MERLQVQRSEACNLALLSVMVLTFTYAILSNLEGLMADEGFHNPEIMNFFSGTIPAVWHITVPPVYHFTIAALLRAFGVYSIDLARFSHILICIPIIPFLYLTSKELKFTQNDYRTLLFLTCPIVLPFFSLLYTDLPASMLAALTLLLTVRKQYYLAGLAGALAIATRQPNLVWVAFCGAYVFSDYVGQQGLRNTLNYRNRENWCALLKILPYISVCIIAAGIFYFRNSVALGDAGNHQVSFNPSNLYLFLLVSFVIFLPYHIYYTPRAAALLKELPIIWLLILGGLLFYLYTYSNSHPYNAKEATFFYRNVILHHTLSKIWLKFLIFIPMISAVFTFYFFWKDSQPQHKLLLLLIYVFGLFTFVPLPMVEPRYYLTALAFIIAVKPAISAKLDLACLVINIPICCLVLFCISKFWMFI